MSTEERFPIATNKAIDLSHHISEIAKARKPSPLKDVQKHPGSPELISFAGGMPDPSYFPFESISADVLVPNAFLRTEPSQSSLFSWFWNIFGPSTKKTERFTVPKFGQPGDVDLATTLQYSPVTGHKALQDFIHGFSGKVYKPAYSDWSTIVTTGNTDGCHRAIATLCNPGEHVLVEEWTYPTTAFDILPAGMFAASVKVDEEGMSAVDLEHVLSTWDESARKAKRPHVMYTIPVGQNPTGVTMSVERKKAVYDLCVKYDIIIIEDDPYYFFQEGPYISKEMRSKSKTTPSLKKGEDEEKRFLDSLVPTYLRFDYQGRVVRLDTFSKITAPGVRLGWFTCNPLFADRFERQGETTTLAPCGFSQSFITQLFSKHWSFSDVIRWLQGLQTQYTLRRDYFVDCIFDEFDVRPASDPALLAAFGSHLPMYTAYTKIGGQETENKARDNSKKTTPLFSFVPPSAGMFVWLRFHLQDHMVSDPNVPDDETIDMKLWTHIVGHGLLVTPGISFGAHRYERDSGSSQKPPIPHSLTYRLSFGMGSNDQLKTGVKILANAIKSYEF